ncbi:uncharacterized protein FMAN_06678 [Fusarium mangiferae]|uniref:Uncharacterized protein n=1 Tax=Fusarium mangiferae TaxID=192010 RepID=A0A1L7STL0_FUSMA|nr:uncharacterized protein FMAN_06678 [Fusarium mangiferae]CVK85797.1 uncharacterized protein FMAN_06678 [Fusarium mangiferae]
MKRAACRHDNSPEDNKDDSEKRPSMEQDQIGTHQLYSCRPAPRPPTPPLQQDDFPDYPTYTLYGVDVPMPKKTNDLPYTAPLSPPETTYDSSTCSEHVFSSTDSNLDSPPQSPISSTTGSEEEPLSIRERSHRAECFSQSPLSVSVQNCSESDVNSLSSENSRVPASSCPKLPLVFGQQSIFPLEMDTYFNSTSSYIKPGDSAVLQEQLRRAIKTTPLPSPQDRAVGWLKSSSTPEHDVGFLKALEFQSIMYTAMETEPGDFGPRSSSIANLPECIRVGIMTFFTEPKDLFSLISSSPVFLQPFSWNRHQIVSHITQRMRFRFGGDMPHSCLMAARLRNMESKSVVESAEDLKAIADISVKEMLKFSPRGPLLHSSYSLRLLEFISDTLDTAERVMTSYAHQARVHNPGPSLTARNLVLSETERKRFMDAICLYDAYCTAFFSEYAISSDGDNAIRQSFLEEDGIPGEIITRFYSIALFLNHSYHRWISAAIQKRHQGLSFRGRNYAFFLPSEEDIGQLVNHFVCSGPSVFRMLQDMRRLDRYNFLFKLLGRCKMDAAYHQKVTTAQGRGDKRAWAYREIMAALTRQEVHTAQHFWDPVVVGNMKTACHRSPSAVIHFRSRPDA